MEYAQLVEEIEKRVREHLSRMPKSGEIPDRVVSTLKVQRLFEQGCHTIRIAANSIITPDAKDYIRTNRITIERN